MEDAEGKRVLQKTTNYQYDNNGNQLRQAVNYLLPHNRQMRQSSSGIVEKKAEVSEPYYSRIKIYGDENPNEKFYPVNILRDWVYDLGSEKHKMKMEIVEEFARQGVNYWDTEIPRRTLERIQKRYPDTWQEYIKQY